MYTQGNSRTLAMSSESMFTDHAAVQYLQRYSPLIRNFDNSRPLLDDVYNNGYGSVKSLVQKTFPKINVSKMHQVNAPQMYGMYLLRKEEMMANNVQEKLLYHVTTESRAIESLKSGLDWRRTRRSKFGCGVSFSDDADYANYYADKFTQEETRVIIVCNVLVNNTHRVTGNRNEGFSLMVPPGTADTTMSNNGRVYVKYNDFDFYPLYFVYYNERPEYRTKSKYFKGNRRMGAYDDYYDYYDDFEQQASYDFALYDEI